MLRYSRQRLRVLEMLLARCWDGHENRGGGPLPVALASFLSPNDRESFILT